MVLPVTPPGPLSFESGGGGGLGELAYKVSARPPPPLGPTPQKSAPFGPKCQKSGPTHPPTPGGILPTKPWPGLFPWQPTQPLAGPKMFCGRDIPWGLAASHRFAYNHQPAYTPSASIKWHASAVKCDLHCPSMQIQKGCRSILVMSPRHPMMWGWGLFICHPSTCWSAKLGVENFSGRPSIAEVPPSVKLSLLACVGH